MEHCLLNGLNSKNPPKYLHFSKICTIISTETLYTNTHKHLCSPNLLFVYSYEYSSPFISLRPSLQPFRMLSPLSLRLLTLGLPMPGIPRRILHERIPSHSTQTADASMKKRMPSSHTILLSEIIFRLLRIGKDTSSNDGISETPKSLRPLPSRATNPLKRDGCVHSKTQTTVQMPLETLPKEFSNLSTKSENPGTETEQKPLPSISRPHDLSRSTGETGMLQRTMIRMGK